MTLRDAEKLKAGDKVYWTSPCKASQNRAFNVEWTKVVGDTVYIKDADSSIPYATYPDELSYVN